jgi:hypothetical protein
MVLRYASDRRERGANAGGSMSKTGKQRGGRKKGQAEKMLAPEKGIGHNALLAKFGSVAEDSNLFLLMEFLSWKELRRGNTEPYSYFITNGAREFEWDTTSINFFREGTWNRIEEFKHRCSLAVQNQDTNFFKKVAQITDYLKSDDGKMGIMIDQKRCQFADAYFSCFPRDTESKGYAPTFRDVMEKLADKWQEHPDESDARGWSKEMGMILRPDRRGPKQAR